ncbi:hypothetical protein EDC01DRAFT_626051 [Geopyxis carbonaria]|nr:hypothetical protein EDC01DRAFT_626051 [Geopyxis carbonaria]
MFTKVSFGIFFLSMMGLALSAPARVLERQLEEPSELPTTFEFLDLPEDFFTHTEEELSNDTYTILPATPKGFEPTIFTATPDSRLPATSVHCQTSSGSPSIVAVMDNAKALIRLGSHWCCSTGRPKCSTLFTSRSFGNSASTSLCAHRAKLTCLRCVDAGNSNKWIVEQCTRNVWQAGGYVSWQGVADVNAWRS